MRLFIRIFTKNESIEINPDDFDFIQDVILVRTDLLRQPTLRVESPVLDFLD